MAITVEQLLNEAQATEQALITTLQAHLSMTPPGPHRQLLDRHLTETRRHARAVGERLGELDAAGGVVAAGTGLMRTVVGQALALSKGPFDLLRGGSMEEKLLKNARDECATEALEIATYDALEALAEASGDRETARLAARHRTDEERMLADLRRLLPELARAATEREPAPPDNVTPLRGEPLAGYDRLNAGQVAARLSGLGQAQLRAVGAYERAHRNRRTVLERISTLEGPEPVDGYDELSEAAAIARLRESDDATVTRIRDYESRHRRSVAVLEAAQKALSRSG
jgi:ferritin-like metal-binding protein YciE